MHSSIDFKPDLPGDTQIPSRWSFPKSASLQASERTALVQPDEHFPLPPWTHAISDTYGRRFPQAIAHRGYKARHPENTMCAFRAAVKGRAHAIETDVHLSKDGVIMLSHDADLKRCFGVKKKIIDCDWAELSQLRTLQPPHEPMPRLQDLLTYLSQPGLEHIWVLLDIKRDNDAEDVIRLIARTLTSVSPSPTRIWRERIVLGIWVVKFLPLCIHYLPNYPITHIGYSTSYARKFLTVPKVGFNMLHKVLLGPIGTKFIDDIKHAKRPLFVWTVNERNLMKWSIQEEVDGVITDDVETFRQVCDDWTDGEDIQSLTFATWLYTFWLHFSTLAIGLLLRYRFPETVEDFIRLSSPRMDSEFSEPGEHGNQDFHANIS